MTVPRTRAWRIFRWALVACVLTVVAGGVWLVITAVMARSALDEARSSLSAVRTDVADQDLVAARRDSALLASSAHRAHHLTTGPAWAVAAALPYLGDPAQVVRGLADQTDRLASTALPAVLRVGTDLASGTLRSGNSINLAPLIQAAPTVHSAATLAASAQASIADLPSHTWLGAVDHARTQVATGLAGVTKTLDGADRACQLVPSMLGQRGTRRFFVAIQNEAEARGLGGLPGAFAILTADNGKIGFTFFGSDTALKHVDSHAALSPDFVAKWANASPADTYTNSNVGASIADAGRIWAGMWKTKSGQSIDGVIAVDPTALGYLLRAAGSVQMSDGRAVTASNIVSLTQKQLYSEFSDQTARRAYLVDIARAVDQKLLGSGDLSGLLHEAFRASSENRIQVWSSHADEEAVLRTTSFSGFVPDNTRPVSGFTVIDAIGSKLEYYLRRQVSITTSACTTTTRGVTATVVLTNAAPASGLPAYVTTYLGTRPASYRPGDTKVLVTYYATAGSTPKSLTVDGKQVAVNSAPENGLVALTATVDIPVGASRTVSVAVTEPARSGARQYINQPLVQTAAVTTGGC